MSITIGQMNPGGRNNAIYTFVRDTVDNRIKQITGGEIYGSFSANQNKFKYNFILDIDSSLNGSNPPATPQFPLQTFRIAPTNNLYWQTEINGKDVCTVGETVGPAGGTNALVIRQALNTSLPAQ